MVGRVGVSGKAGDEKSRGSMGLKQCIIMLHIKVTVYLSVLIFLLFSCSNGNYKEYLLKGDTALRNNDYSMALIYFNKAIDINQTNPQLFYKKAAALKMLGKMSLAKNAINRAIDSSPQNSDYYTLRASINKELGLNMPAIKDYKEATRLDPFNVLAYNNLGLLLIKENKLKEASFFIEKVIMLDSTVAQAYNNRGMIKDINDDFSGAIEDYSKAIQLDSSVTIFYINRAKLYFFINQFELANDDVDKALGIDSLNGYYYYIKSQIYLKKHDTVKACEFYNKATKYGYKSSEQFDLCN